MTASDFIQGFHDLDLEVADVPLPVHGRLPAWLRGTLFRNGPACFTAGAVHLRHWFDGFAMLHRIVMGDGPVSYSNSFLGSRSRLYAQRHGRLGYRTFTTDPARGWPTRIRDYLFPNPGDNGLVSLIRHRGELLALTESTPQLRVDPVNLSVTGRMQYRDSLVGHLTTAHPHIDANRGEVVNLLTRFGKVSSYQFYRMPMGGDRREIIGTLPASEPSYNHSFGMTASHIILIEYPFVVKPLQLLFGSTTILGSYVWKPELGTRIRVIERGTGALVRTFQAAPRFGFHHVNAYHQDRELIVDVSVSDTAEILDSLYLERLRSAGPRPFPYLLRYRLDLASGTHCEQRLSDEALDFPIVDQRCLGSAHRVVHGVGARPTVRGGFLDRLVRVSLDGSPPRQWSSPRCYPGEGLFVAQPGAVPESAGVILSVVLDAAAERSFLLVCDAMTYDELARCPLPHAVPFGFHGLFTPALT